MREVFINDVKVQSSEPISNPDKDLFNNLNLSGRKKFYDQGYYGQGIVVAVIDSGCSPHNEFGNRILPAPNLCTLGLTSNDSLDTLGHGTHVAGTIAGGLLCGIAPKAQILPLKVINAMGDGAIRDVINALKFAKNWVGSNGEKVDLINMSISSTPAAFANNPALLAEYEKAIDDCVAADIAVIVAAGNSGKEEVLYPAFFKNVIAVAAVDATTKIAYFSTKSKEIDVCQIGVDVLSAYFADKTKYRLDTGTSMASPHVTGIAALIACKYKELFKKRIPESTLYEMIKMNTIDLDIKGVDINTGAGFCSLMPSIKTITIEMTENNPTVKVNGKSVLSDAAPIVVPPGRFMAPVRFVAENLGGQASYNPTTKTAKIELTV